MPRETMGRLCAVAANGFDTGLPDFSCSKHTKTGKICQMSANYAKLPQIIPDDRKYYNLA
jgi:hypothetical protein